MLNGASVADSRCRCPARRGRDLSAGQFQSTPPAWLRNWRRVRSGPWASAPRTLALPARWAASGAFQTVGTGGTYHSPLIWLANSPNAWEISVGNGPLAAVDDFQCECRLRAQTR